MNTISNEGLTNIYASEPSVYYAEYPSQEQQNRYLVQGAIATLFVSLLILTSLAVS
ncbi:ssl1498 family light-harvesting-like protein [Leptolyngbya sp. 'hensonii']|uniref:photosystem II assembly protein Psb34 n=1 Tax=Leptolyngbya sp. 'hensonii' TaxID=1922337 RepID=UPI000A766712|nr:ssl1498 family light-harvesting-like protein [Leptolyngbya sp. 'hensonii']